MALKLHIIAREWTAPGARVEMVTLCGESAFKGRVVASAEEWEASRRIGGLRAVPESKWYPDRDSCGKCKARWMAGAYD